MSFANPWDNPDYFQQVKIGGRPIAATLVAIKGLGVEDDWNVQRVIGQTGAVNVFRGTKPVGPVTLTFRMGGDTIDELRYEWNDLREVYEIIAPKPGFGSAGQGTTVGSPGSAAYGKQYVHTSTNTNPAPTATAEQLLAQAQTALTQLQSGAAAASSATSAGPVASVLSPGPKPPTLSIENGYLNYFGFNACSRAKWDGPLPDATNGQEVNITLVLQKAPSKVAVGPGAAASSGVGGGPVAAPAAAAKTFNQGAAAAGAGT